MSNDVHAVVEAAEHASVVQCTNDRIVNGTYNLQVEAATFPCLVVRADPVTPLSSFTTIQNR
jgi:hypothetical protein